MPLHTKVAEETAEGVRRKAKAVGMTDSEYINEVLAINVHGEDMIKRLAMDRIAVVSGKAPLKP